MTGYPLYEFVSSALAQGSRPCPAGSANRLGCVGGMTSYGLLAFITNGTNPRVTFEIHDGTGAVAYSRTVRASALVVP